MGRAIVPKTYSLADCAVSISAQTPASMVYPGLEKSTASKSMQCNSHSCEQPSFIQPKGVIMSSFHSPLKPALAGLALAASMLVATPAFANTIVRYSSDNGAQATIVWYWAGSTRRMTLLQLSDNHCDDRAPKVYLYQNYDRVIYRNTRGCGTTNTYYTSIDFNAFQVCNTNWAGTHCGPIIRP